MIAVFGTYGSAHHRWARVSTRAQADAFFARCVARAQSDGWWTVSPAPTEVLSERDAAKRRRRGGPHDGAPLYPPGETAEVDWSQPTRGQRRRKALELTLSDEAREKLDAMATARGESRSRVVEGLVMGAER